jgi:CheY-like chemotaxis protein
MTPSASAFVRRVLARRLRTPVAAIHEDQRLGIDLGLDAFDVVLLGIDLEEQESGHGRFPVEQLDPAMDVAQLEALCAAWMARHERTSAGGDRNARREHRAPVSVAGHPDTLPSAARTMHVLVADDDPEMRAFLVESLREDGHRVSEVASGLELLRVTSPEALAEAHYDAIVSDVLMPGDSGLDALMQINAEPEAPPVVLMTAFGGRDVHRRAAQLGAAAVLDKPFDVDDLKRVLFDAHAAGASRGRTPQGSPQ